MFFCSKLYHSVVRDQWFFIQIFLLRYLIFTVRYFISKFFIVRISEMNAFFIRIFVVQFSQFRDFRWYFC